MAFDYEIVAHGDKADATNKRIEAGLVKVTEQATTTGVAMDKAFAGQKLKDAEGKFIATSVASQRMKDHVNDLTSAWEREDAVLERIKGPAREHESDLKALSSLYKQNQISAKEYESELDRLMKKEESRKHGKGGEEGGAIEGSFTKAIGSRFGEGGNVLSGLASGAGVEAAGLVALGAEVLHVSDEYSKLTNQALRLSDGFHSTNQTLDQQLSLAGRLHGSLEETMELSIAIKERTDELNITDQQRLDLTERLGEAAALSGQSMGSAASVLERVQFALESGLPAGRQMKQLFIEFPPIAAALREAFHKSDAELLNMFNHGKIGAEAFDRAIMNSTSIGEEFAKRHITFAESIGHKWDEAKVSVGNTMTFVAESFNGKKSLMDEILNTGPDAKDGAREAIKLYDEQTSAMRKVTFEAAHLKESYADLSSEEKHFNDVTAAANKMIEESTGKYSSSVAKIDGFKEAMSRVRIEWAQQNVLMRSLGQPALPFSKFVSSTGINAASLMDDIAKAQRALTDSTSAYGDVVGPIHQKEMEHEQGVKRITAALASGDVSQKEYVEDMKQYASALTGIAATDFAAIEHNVKIAETKQQIADLKVEVHQGSVGWKEYEQKYRSLLDTLEGGRSTFREIYYALRDPQQKFNESIAATKALYQSNTISLMEYENELEKLQKNNPYFADLEQQIKRDVAAYDKLAATEKMYREMHEHGISSPASVGLEGAGDTMRAMNRQAESDLVAAKAEDVRETSRVNEQEKKNLEIVSLRIELLKKLATPAEKVREDITQMNKAFADGSGGSLQDYDRLMQDLKARFFDIAPEEKYAKALKQIDDVAHQLDATTEELDRAHLKLKQEFGQPLTLGEGIDSGLAKLKKEMLDVGSVAETALVNAFHGIENAIVDVVTKGSADWSKMVQSMEADLARLALRELEMKVVKSLFGSPDLPAHDMGASWVVPGTGGADTSLQAFWASPGETVTVTPSGGGGIGRRGGDGGGGGGLALHLHLQDDPRALPMAMTSGAGRRATAANIARSPEAIRRLLR